MIAGIDLTEKERSFSLPLNFTATNVRKQKYCETALLNSETIKRWTE